MSFTSSELLAQEEKEGARYVVGVSATKRAAGNGVMEVKAITRGEKTLALSTVARTEMSMMPGPCNNQRAYAMGSLQFAGLQIRFASKSPCLGNNRSSLVLIPPPWVADLVSLCEFVCACKFTVIVYFLFPLFHIPHKTAVEEHQKQFREKGKKQSLTGVLPGSAPGSAPGSLEPISGKSEGNSQLRPGRKSFEAKVSVLFLLL